MTMTSSAVPISRICIDAPVMRRTHGSLLLASPPHWRGPEIGCYALPADAEHGPQTTGIPVVFVGGSWIGWHW